MNTFQIYWKLERRRYSLRGEDSIWKLPFLLLSFQLLIDWNRNFFRPNPAFECISSCSPSTHAGRWALSSSFQLSFRNPPSISFSMSSADSTAQDSIHRLNFPSSIKKFIYLLRWFSSFSLLSARWDADLINPLPTPFSLICRLSEALQTHQASHCRPVDHPKLLSQSH